MLHLAAILAFVLSVIFYAWSITHGIWAWQFFMVIGLALWCISGKKDF